MTTSQQESGRRRRWWRWPVGLALVGLLLLILAAAALPWIVSFPWVQRRLEVEANRVLAPGEVHFDRIIVSWSQPTDIRGLVLRDPEKDEVVTSPLAHFSWNLWQILFTRPMSATLTLDQANLDLQRLADGSVDLLRTLKPILSDRPERTLLVRIPDGKLRFRIEGLEDPILADKAAIALDLNRYPEPLGWKMTLERAGNDNRHGKLDIVGKSERTEENLSKALGDLTLSLKGDRWPWSYTTPSLKVRGAFEGTVGVEVRGGRMQTSGQAQFLDLLADGSALSGDSLKLESMEAGWKLEGQDGTWTVTRLDVTSALGRLTANGTVPPVADRGARVEGSLDLAALATQLPRTLRLRNDIRLNQGAIQLQAEVAGDAGGKGQTIEATAKVTDLVARQGSKTLTLRDPATFAARIVRKPDALDLQRLDVKTPFLLASGQGDLDKGISVSASMDLAAARERLRDWIDLGKVELAGQGKFDAHYKRTGNTFAADGTAEVKGLSLSGLPLIETLRRDLIRVVADVKGGAMISGLPANLQTLRVSGQSGTDDLKLEADYDEVTRVVSARVNALAELVLNGSRQTAEGNVKARWGDQDVSFDRLLLSFTPVVGPGGQFLPGDPVRWSGTGKYDIGKDELLILADAGPQGAATTTLALSPERVRIQGLQKPESASAEVNLLGDVAALAKLAQREQVGLSGVLSAVIQARQSEGTWELGLRAQTRNLSRIGEDKVVRPLDGEIAAAVRASYHRAADRLDLPELAVVTPYGRIEGSGPVTDLSGSPRFDLKGNLSPDWKVLSSLLSQKVEPNASIAGRPSPWQLAGTLPRDEEAGKTMFDSFDAVAGVYLDELDVFGMRLGQSNLVVRTNKGLVTVDPIDSTLNAGRLHLEPQIVKDKEGKSWLRLARNNTLYDAVINDEVSHRVLMFAAPVLDQATRVQGRVSFELVDAMFPISAAPGAQAKVEGDVQFDEVQFNPGPLANEILSVFRQEGRPLLYLRDPVSVRILGRKVYQEGLILPVGKVAVIGVEGWVDFDQNIDLLASFAMVPPQKNIPVISRILEGTQIRVPITGTLKKPRLDGEAIKDRFKDMGTNLLETTLGIGADGLGRLLRGRRGGPPPRDFFPPLPAPLDDGGPPVPPQPGLGNGNRARPGEKEANRGGQAGNNRPPAQANPEDGPRVEGEDAEPPPLRPGQIQREERRLRRMEKRAERRTRRGLPPN